MNELEKVREQIANLRLPVNNQPNHKYRYLNYELADQILSLKTGSLTLKELIEKYEKGELLETAENQDLPRNPYGLKQGYDSAGSFAMVDSPERWGYGRGQYNMLKEGWVKCKVKEE